MTAPHAYNRASGCCCDSCLATMRADAERESATDPAAFNPFRPRIAYSYEQPTRRARLVTVIGAMREIARVAGRRCDYEMEQAIDAANRLRLRTAARHLRSSWRAWQTCVRAEGTLRDAERELANMEAS